MHTEIKRDLEAQKAAIEARGRMKGSDLELLIETWVVGRNDRWYSSGTFGFSDVDEMTRAEAERLAFEKGGKVYPAKVFWGKKYQTICDALSRL